MHGTQRTGKLGARRAAAVGTEYVPFFPALPAFAGRKHLPENGILSSKQIREVRCSLGSRFDS